MDLSWVFYLAICVCFIFAFGIGANDVANSFGTSIGSGALTLGQAICIAAVCEMTGAVTLAAGVSDTITRQIADLDTQSCWDCGGEHSKMAVFMLGMTCALVAGAAFLLLATWFAMPVSTTHAIVGAVLGMSLVGAGAACVRWGYPGLLAIIASWIWSPLAAGLASGLCMLAIKHLVLQAPNAERRALRALPVLFGATLGVMLGLILLKAPMTAAWPAWQLALVPAAVALGIAALVQLFLVPLVRRSISAVPSTDHAGWGESTELRLEAERSEGPAGSVASSAPKIEVELSGGTRVNGDLRPLWDNDDGNEESAGLLAHATRTASEQERDAFWEDNSLLPGSSDKREGNGHAVNIAADGNVIVGTPAVRPAPAEQVFMYLQVLSACLKSFAHGANDTANASGPFAAVQALYLHGLSDCASVSTPLWVLAFCGVGIVVGLATCGSRVMNTVGKDITEINFSRGFAIELGSTLSVILASVVGMPVSSTHCQIGSIVAVGVLESGASNVHWGVFRNIVIAWLVTVPLSAGVAGVLLLALRPLVT
ncbi:hypothetical protein WJX73_003429 [Symbiochloris irregularis]|uniref:Phosphate transporter n=1 Tax=Symbiochloris irregularis TaxID=706552 RepID=A0AAW1NRH8_9CHLO